MKVVFYQNKDEFLSINLLFNIIQKKLPVVVQFSIKYFRHNGSSLKARFYDILSGAFTSKKNINHIIGDFNYATLLMPKATTILTIHDLYRLYLFDTNPIKKYIFKLLWLRLPILKSGIITAVSQTTKNEILKFSNCSPEKIRVIYNCISPDFTPLPKIFNKQKPVLLQIGTRLNKNTDRLAEAISGIPCKLEIVGKPTDRTIEILKKFNIDYNCQSNLSDKEVIKKYLECDMLVFISTYEGFGMPIIEANCIERAVVTGNVSAMPEVAGTAACLVNPFDIASMRAGILKVINDDVYRESIIAEGRINKLRFEATNIANQYAQLYQEVDGQNN